MSNLNDSIVQHKNNFINNLEKTGWSCLLPFINSSQFDQIFIQLYNNHLDGHRFTPKFKDVMNAFIHCPYDKLKVIFVGQDPYPQQDVADGISFSCSKTMKEQPSLRFIFNYLESKDPNYNRDPNLKRWAEQGVLMLNTAMTVQIGKIGSHYNIWIPWTRYLFTELNKRNDLQIVLLGKKAEAWELSLMNNTIYKVSHPAAAAYKGGKWDAKDVFNKINEELANQDKSLIMW